MPFSYDNLWKLSIDKKMNKTQLRDNVGITSATLARLSKGQPVSMDVLGRICETLSCDICDIVSYVSIDENEEE